NTIERAVLFAEGDTVKTKDLSCILSGSPYEEGLKTIKELEKEYIERVLRMVNYNKRRASQILGIPLRTFYRKLEAYGIG
ncbi:MAG TPA: sigma-54-dependent Fis family transcriptional regulator, partial [Aquificaceae bacterium]|nr:sigma-54-dependent Fis family transcriptional regulator [Aquificaceae bacterium]